MAKFTLNGYNSYSGCDIVVTARLNNINTNTGLAEKVYTLGSLQTLSVSTHQDKKPVRVIGSANALDYVLGQRTIAGSLVFAVFDQHFATEMFNDLSEATGKSFFLPDELPGLDITISFANEYGRQSRMAIYGVRIVNEGQVMSINDLYTENTYQFVALSMEPLTKNTKSNSNKSDNNDNIYIESSLDDNANSINTTNNINKTRTINDIDITSKINLSVSIEQPTYINEDGIVKLYISPKQKSGTISIKNRKTDKIINEIQVLSTNSQYIAYLQAGEYSAWYSNNNQILSNTVTFTINNITISNTSYNDTPVIEKITDTSIEALSNNIVHTIGVCLNPITGETYETDITARSFKFNNLEPSTSYQIYTKDNKTTNSKSINALTLDTPDTVLNLFKDYVRYNKNLLSKDYSVYEPLLDTLIDNDYIYTLAKYKSDEAKELMFMAIKFNNEITSIFNNDNCDNMPIKSIDNIYGNTFKFNNSLSKANVFLIKDKRNYFEYSEAYPIEVTYDGKVNSLYSVIGINDNFVKSPKYIFYSYDDNDKEMIKQQFGNTNILNNIEVKTISNYKLSNEALKCLTAKEEKTKDINLLKAPSGYIDNKCNLIVNIDYKDILGEQNNIYYLCISKLDECLDTTPFRKIRIDIRYSTITINNLLTAINKNDIYTMWIEDEQFNIISDLGFISYLEENTTDLNSYIIQTEIKDIIKKIENNIDKPNYLSDITNSIDYSSLDMNDIYKELSIQIMNQKENDAFNLLYNLFKIRFLDICINREKYKTVTYNTKDNMIIFNDAYNIELVQISIKKDNYVVSVIKDNKTYINDDYDYNLFYIISSNPVIKSGFILIDTNKSKALSYLINLEVI